ncbi:MAG TPA: helix-turn-helix domain-containing protein, partial [Thermomicrobiales bacterium]|nr:helix-turn-helix domain-containing protein [Thermomicrobiales bacterium]
MATPSSAFGGLLRRYRLAAGLTQEALAERAGVSARAVGDLERDGGRAPRLDTVALLVGALALPPEHEAQLRAAARPDLETAERDRPRPNGASPLLTPPTPLIGREQEVATALALLRHDAHGGTPVRLLTLTGPGGVGKTRLALHLAAELRADFPGAVQVVSLAALTEPALVLPAIAGALGVREVSGQALLTSLAAALGEQPALLVLDNCEQVLDAAPQLAALLAAAPRLQVIATSRTPLEIRGEQQFPVLPLALPAPDAVPLADQAGQSAAVRLFLDRARAAQPGFALTTANVAAVVAICRRLDGLPLALELAAPRLQLLSPRALLARLDSRLPLLTGGAADLPARQRTLRATLDWSHALLAPAEQTLFARLAVFAGGASLAAIEAIGGDAGDAPADVLACLEALLRASLLRRTTDDAGDVRIGMLETIREYAAERLAVSGEEDAIRSQHAAYYLALAEARG